MQIYEFSFIFLTLRFKKENMSYKYRIITGLCLWAGASLLPAMAQTMQYRFRVELTDKAPTTYTLDKPDAYLSQRAIARRATRGIAIDSTDLPVATAYLKLLEADGGKVVCTGKWTNTAVLESNDEQAAERFARHPFVKTVKKVWTSSDSIPPRNSARKKEVTNHARKQEDYYGVAGDQLRTHHGDSLHLAGFKGQGMVVAVIDAGFYNVDAIKMFRKTHIAGTRDFVNPRSDIYAESNHGLKVLSCLAANEPGIMVGTAPEATYWLLRSEDNDSEQPVEEDYWEAAVEFADSVGTDVINTSLGYFAFDHEADNYRYRDLNGKVSLMSRAASHIAPKGMLLVCSAGNSGSGTWKKITPPADAEAVITVGAIDEQGINTIFSSVGNTADGRIKPDVMALGMRVNVAGTDGGTSFANGTSFSAPIFCGLATCLWQACPQLNVYELMEVIHHASDRHAWPDNIYGYGVTDIWKAYQSAKARNKQ